ncbi:MAG TPA: nicotinamide riboside transporter PnuC [Gemmatimonadaceae bacterium]|nr:nicotinamide riboside transporter PnuC [Gemmatimonadaceae bacterium]
MSTLEWIAALAGAVSVYLSARENIWSWPTAIVNVGLYIIVFRRTGLYSDMGLQVVYLVLSIYGWYQWLYGGTNRTELSVSRAALREWTVVTPIAVVFWVALARYTATLPGVALPYLDAGLTTISLVAQWMMTRKILENWVLWIVADVVYVPMYVYKGLPVTAALYAVFLVLAVIGLRSWRRSYRERPVAEPVPA